MVIKFNILSFLFNVPVMSFSNLAAMGKIQKNNIKYLRQVGLFNINTRVVYSEAETNNELVTLWGLLQRYTLDIIFFNLQAYLPPFLFSIVTVGFLKKRHWIQFSWQLWKQTELQERRQQLHRMLWWEFMQWLESLFRSFPFFNLEEKGPVPWISLEALKGSGDGLSSHFMGKHCT